MIDLILRGDCKNCLNHVLLSFYSSTALQCYFFIRSNEHTSTHASPPFTEDFTEAHFGIVFTAPNGTLSTSSSSSSPWGRKSCAVDFSSNVTHARSKLAPHHVGVKGSMKSRLDSLQDRSRGSANDDFFCFFFCFLPFQSSATATVKSRIKSIESSESPTDHSHWQRVRFN